MSAPFVFKSEEDFHKFLLIAVRETHKLTQAGWTLSQINEKIIDCAVMVTRVEEGSLVR